MKLTKISMAVGSLFALASTSSFALEPASYTNTSEFVGDTLNIRASGATAVDPGIFASALRLCATGGANTIHRYSIQNNAVLFCNIDSTKLTAPAGKTKLAFYKYSQGGSGGGVQNVNNATLIPFIDLDKLKNPAVSCAAPVVTASVDLDGASPLPSFVDTLCTGNFDNTVNATNAVSYIGISDVEPQFFGGPSSFNNLASGALVSVIFGLPVTKNVFEIMQAQQGLTVGDLTEANMPSLSQGQVTSMYTQEGQTWSTLLGTATNLADDTIYVARRASTSGTQKSYEAVIAKTQNSTATAARSCHPAAEPFVSGPEAGSNTAANTLCDGNNIVVNNSGSNQVLTCMNRHAAGGRAAVGILSTEFKQTPAGEVRFVKANGVAPTYRGVASGQYQYYTDVALNTRIGNTLPTANALGYANYIVQLKAGFAAPATVEIINASNQTFGPSGLVALDVLLAAPPAPDFLGLTARNPWNRLVGGTALNNCQAGKL